MRLLTNTLATAGLTLVGFAVMFPHQFATFLIKVLGL